MKRDLTAAYVRSILHYDPETGVFTWRRRPLEHFETKRSCGTWNGRYAGNVAGRINIGYVDIHISNTMYLAHRLAWLYMTGSWPKECIDHINMNRSDNRFCNLREATHSENKFNRPKQSKNTSGHKGVTLHKPNSKWVAKICANGKHRNLGYFDTREDAAAAYAKAARELHGEFARTE